MGEIPSGWVPDKLPDFKDRKFPVTVNDPQIAAEVLSLADSFKIEPVELSKKFVLLGLLVAKFESESDSILVERDQMGRKLPVFLNDQEYHPTSFNIDERQIQKRKMLVFSLPGDFVDPFMELANRYHTSVDDVLKKMFILGINVVRAGSNRDKSYIVENKDGTDQEINFF